MGMIPITFWGAARPTVSNHATLPTNLVAYWEMDETSGSRADNPGTNDLTDNNTVGYGTGMFGNAAYFVHANDEYLSRSDNANLSIADGNTSFSFAFWLKLDQAQNSGDVWDVIAKAYSYPSEVAYRIYLVSNKIRFHVSRSDRPEEFNLVSSSQLAAGNWYWCCAWYDASADKMYIQINNNTPDELANSYGSYDDITPFQVGRSSSGSALQGYVDELGFWKKALSSSERSALYNNGAGIPYD